MHRLTPWIPLTTIVGLSVSLAVLLARPPHTTIVITTVVPSPTLQVAPHVVPAFCYRWDLRYSSIDLRPWCS